VRILVDGDPVAEGRIERQVLIIAGIGESFDIGDDTGVPVLDYPQGHARLTGQIRNVVVRPGSLKILR
jgi:hypothetical protein